MREGTIGSPGLNCVSPMKREDITLEDLNILTMLSRLNNGGTLEPPIPYSYNS